MTKPWYKSKTKLGSVVFGVGTILVSAGSYMMGNIDAESAIRGALIGVSAILVGTGIRDAIETKK